MSITSTRNVMGVSGCTSIIAIDVELADGVGRQLILPHQFQLHLPSPFSCAAVWILVDPSSTAAPPR